MCMAIDARSDKYCSKYIYRYNFLKPRLPHERNKHPQGNKHFKFFNVILILRMWGVGRL